MNELEKFYRGAVVEAPRKNYMPLYVALGVGFGALGMVLAAIVALVVVAAISAVVVGAMAMFGIIYVMNGKVEK